MKSGRRSRDRTCDLSLVRAALFRLSYPPGSGHRVGGGRASIVSPESEGEGGCDATLVRRTRTAPTGVSFAYSRSFSGTFSARARRRTMSSDGFLRSPASSIARDGGVMLRRSASCYWVSPRSSRSRRIVPPSSSGVTGEVSPSVTTVRQEPQPTAHEVAHDASVACVGRGPFATSAARAWSRGPRR